MFLSLYVSKFQTLKVSKLAEDEVYVSRHLEILLYRNIKGKIQIMLFMDSEPTLESIASSRQVEMKQLRMIVKESKEKCLDGEVVSYALLHTKDM